MTSLDGSSNGRMDWVIADGIGPFFRGYTKRRINWSKIPLAELPIEGAEADRFWSGVREEMREFATRVKAVGYNTVTLDDVAHVVPHALYEGALKLRVERLRGEMKELVGILKSEGMRVLMTTDVIPMYAAVLDEVKGRRSEQLAYFKGLLRDFLEDFTQVDGVVMRLGEGDGHDVEGDLRNELFVRTAGEANAMLKDLLPMFEEHGKVLICRTWTVGAYPIGDLIWHRKRITQFLQGIESPAFILSLKHGESDFFRYLPLNGAFFHSEVAMIVEFQARREYEGAGEYPCFTGWEIERFAEKLRQVPTLIGVSVWVQTGGWHAFRRRSYLGEGSPWVELNSQVAVDVMAKGLSVRESLSAAYGAKVGDVVRFLRMAEEVILRGLYVEEFAQQKWFFRRVRIPPLIHVYWDCVFFYHPIKKLMRHFVQDRERAIADSQQVLEYFPEMEQLAERIGWSVEDVRFMRDTFAVFAKAREYYFGKYSEEVKEEMKAMKKEYKKKYPRSVRQRYRIKTDFSHFDVSHKRIAIFRNLLFRKKRGYRMVDHLVTLNLLSWVYRLFSKRYEKHLPDFARESAMGVETLFK